MSMRPYPRINYVRDMRKKWVNAKGVSLPGRPICCVCGQPAEATVFVEVDCFRGNDGMALTCWDHRNDAEAIAASGKMKP